MSDKQNKLSDREQQDTPEATGDYQTPIEESDRKTGVAVKTDGKRTAEQESGSSDPLVEGAGNQGTEKR